MKGKILIFVFISIFIFFDGYVFASDSVDVSAFISSVKEYSSEAFPEIADENWLSDVLKGDMEISTQSIIKRFLNIFLSGFKDNIGLLFKILGIAFLCAILKNIQSSFGGRRKRGCFLCLLYAYCSLDCNEFY